MAARTTQGERRAHLLAEGNRAELRDCASGLVTIQSAMASLRAVTGSELEGNEDEVARLEFLVKRGAVTLLYAAHDEAHNHALVLADYLRNHMERGHEKRPL